MTATIVPLPVRMEEKDLSSPLTKLRIYQLATRKWLKVLSASDFAVIVHIIDRTYGWGRSEAYFSIRAMQFGDSAYDGMSLSRRTIFRSLVSLEAIGLINRRKDEYDRDKVHYSVNLDWTPPRTAVKSTTSQRPDARCQTGTSRCQIDPPQCQIDTLYNSINQPVSDTSIIAAPSAPRPLARFEDVRAKADGAADANRERRAARAASGRTDVSTALEASWRNALAEAFPGHAATAWGVREKAQAKRVAKNWIRSNAISFAEFINWSVLNWTAIMRKQFKWMTKSPPPAMPTFSFFIAMQGHFADCHADGTLDKWANAKERTEVERMMARGMTYEEATIEHGKNHATKTLRSEMEEREIRARSNEQTAERKLEQARKLAEYGGAAPVHPRSRLALEARARSRMVQPVAVPEEKLPEAKVYFVDPDRNPFDEV